MKAEALRGFLDWLRTKSFAEVCLAGIFGVLIYGAIFGLPWASNKILELRKDERAEAKAALEKAVIDGKEDTSAAKAEAKIALDQYHLTHEKDQLRIVEAFRASHSEIADAVREQSDSIKDMSRDVKSLTETMRDYLKQPTIATPRSP